MPSFGFISVELNSGLFSEKKNKTINKVKK
jgi:hypothetical protein